MAKGMAAIAFAVCAAGLAAQQPVRDAQAARGSATIRGRVLQLETGAPLRGAFVLLDHGGDPARAGVITDDSGEYVLEGVTPGRHNVHVSKVGYVTASFSRRSTTRISREVDLAAGQLLDGLDFTLSKGSVIVARVTDERGEPLSGVAVGALRVAPGGSKPSTNGFTNDIGEVRLYGLMPGEYYVQTNRSLTPNLSAEFAATFYPGTVFFSQAQRVLLSAGQEMSVAFSRVRGRAAHIRGVVRGADGTAFPEHVTLMLVAAGSDGRNGPSVKVSPEGTFEIPYVLPGDYVLQVHPDAELAFGKVQYVWLPLTINDDDRQDLFVTATRGGSVRGRIVSDAGTPVTGVAPGTLQLRLAAASSGTRPGEGEFSVKPDGTFEAVGIMEPRVLRLREPMGGWYLKTVTLDDRDVTDLPIDFSDGRTVSGVRVELTRAHTQVAGSVAPLVQGSTVVLFPDNLRQWTPFTRAIAATPVARDGSFIVTGLPAGSYLAAAISELEPGEERDPTILELLRPFATPFDLTETGSLQLALRLVR